MKTRQESLRTSSPIRTVFEVKDYDWLYENHYIIMTQYYTLWTGHRDVKVKILFEDKLVKKLFVQMLKNWKLILVDFLTEKALLDIGEQINLKKEQ